MVILSQFSSTTHNTCTHDARSMVTFSTAGHHHPLASIGLHFLVTQACVWTTCPESLQWTKHTTEFLHYNVRSGPR